MRLKNIATDEDLERKFLYDAELMLKLNVTDGDKKKSLG